MLRTGRPEEKRQAAEARTAKRLRLALEALGPAFVKLGQALAAREDLLTEAMATELKRLCDQVPSFSNEEALILLTEEGLNELIPAVKAAGKPVAAASLGQVYRLSLPASLASGTQSPFARQNSSGGCCRHREAPKPDEVILAIKLQRPGLAEALALDVAVLKRVARFVRRLVRRFCTTTIDPMKVLDAWAATLWQELDYNREAQVMEKMRFSLCGSGSHAVSGLMIPRVVWTLSSTRVLATEWADGVKVTEQPQRVGSTHIRTGVAAFAAMILEVGVVHADPHAGNLIITHDNQVCLLDFGMVVEVPPAHRKAWAACIVNLVRGNYADVLECLIEIGFFPSDCPKDVILPVMSRIWGEMVACGSNTKKRKDAVRACYAEIRTLVREFEFNLPDYYIALVRALLTIEGIALSADCDFDIFQAAFPVALRALTTAAAAAAKGKALSLGLAASKQMSRYMDRLSEASALATTIVFSSVAAAVTLAALFADDVALASIRA